MELQDTIPLDSLLVSGHGFREGREGPTDQPPSAPEEPPSPRGPQGVMWWGGHLSLCLSHCLRVIQRPERPALSHRALCLPTFCHSL
jgi:hypothetical protein